MNKKNFSSFYNIKNAQSLLLLQFRLSIISAKKGVNNNTQILFNFLKKKTFSASHLLFFTFFFNKKCIELACFFSSLEHFFLILCKVRWQKEIFACIFFTFFYPPSHMQHFLLLFFLSFAFFSHFFVFLCNLLCCCASFFEVMWSFRDRLSNCKDYYSILFKF